MPSGSAATSNVKAKAITQKEEEDANAAIAAAEDGDLEVLSRPPVATAVENFSDPQSVWTFDTSPGCEAEISADGLKLNALARGGFAQCRGRVIIPANSRGRENTFRIEVAKGPVRFKAGTGLMTVGKILNATDDIVKTTVLAEGTHSIAFTPTSDTPRVFVQFETSDQADRIVERISRDSSGELELPTPWSAGDLPYIRYAQSGDVIFVACKGVHPMRIERRGARSWSIVKYLPKDGPLMATASEDVKLTPRGMSGNGFLFAERPFFKASHEGSLFRLFTKGETNRVLLGADDTFSDPIRITGVGGSDRKFTVNVTGLTGSGGRLMLQRSTEDGDLGIGFKNVKSILKDGTHSHNDLKDEGGKQGSPEFNNVICFYRVGFEAGAFGRNAVSVEFREGSGGAGLKSGGRAGLCRVTDFINATSARIEVLKPFSSQAATDNWQQGEWSGDRGYPSSVAFHDGRLWWAGGDKIWGSISDDYSSFDVEKEGDAGTISRSVGFGPVDNINWMLPLSRLIIGRDGAETSIRSSSLDEPITPTSFTLKDCSTKGSDRIAAVKCDTRGVFVSKSGKKAYELSIDAQAGDYKAHELTRLNPEVCGETGFARLCIQHLPDTAVHFVRRDGQVAVLLYDKEDEVEAWWRVVTTGAVEDAFVLPGGQEDNVYYVVRRSIDGAIVRSLERLARRDQCSGRGEARLSDGHVIYERQASDVTNTGILTIRGLNHLEGRQVVVWGWNEDVVGPLAPAVSGRHIVSSEKNGMFPVNNGKITIPHTAPNRKKYCVGLPYDATFKSAKLAYAANQGSAVNQKKRVDHVGLILYDTHYQGLQYGQHADAVDNLPLVEAHQTIATHTVHAEFDEPMIEVPGEWDTDSRLYLKAASPRPCTVAAAVVGIQTHG